jgi:hypothetical protein
MINNWGDDCVWTLPGGGMSRVEDAAQQVVRAIYECGQCSNKLTFLVEFGPPVTNKLPTRTYAAIPGSDGHVMTEGEVVVISAEWVRKVGQCPPGFPEVDRELERALTACGASNLDSYKKALSCEGESYGVGAFAYYRAIVERILESLGASKGAGLEGPAREAFEREWSESSRDGTARIALVYDMLPEELRVDGANPLGHLYSRLSIGLHGGKDEACMKEAEELREELLELVTSLQRERERKAARERMQARQERAKKGTT